MFAFERSLQSLIGRSYKYELQGVAEAFREINKRTIL